MKELQSKLHVITDVIRFGIVFICEKHKFYPHLVCGSTLLIIYIILEDM